MGAARRRARLSPCPHHHPVVVGSDEVFPVRRIYCIGRNYARALARDGLQPEPRAAVLLPEADRRDPVRAPGTVADHPYPSLTKNYHYEAELVAVLGKGGRNIPVAGARPRLGLHARPGHDAPRPAARDGRREEAVGDRQELRPLGADRPGAPVAQTGHFTQGAIWLKVNGQTKQNANLNQMIWSVAEQISKLSEANELFPGDIIYSGTPENVGPVVRGDVIEMHIDGLPNLSVRIV
jgi:fumarylpyruvate hydrolase